jgi:hypothetical protein
MSHVRHFILTGSVLFGAAPISAQSAIRFADTSTEAKVALTHSGLGAFVDGQEIQNLNGSGLGFEDIDGDGWPDLVVASGETGRSVFINQGDGTFLDQSDWFATLPRRASTGVAIADVNNDDRIDLLMTNFYGEPWFFRGNGARLVEQAEPYGLAPLMFNAGQEPPLWAGPQSMGSAFGDWNSDGFVDLYVANYLPFRRDMFLRSLGGAFFQRTDLTAQLDERAGYQPVFLDLDDDGDLDIYVANDFNKNFFLENQGAASGYALVEKAGRFAIDGNWTWPSKHVMSMGVAVGDFDNDLDLDIYITDYEENPLYVNPGGPGPNTPFEERAAQRGVDFPLNCWGTAFFDADNDGDLDLCLTGGWIYSEPFLDQGRAHDDRFYENLGPPNYNFRDVTTDANFHDTESGRGLALADYDRDGRVDVAVWNCTVYDPPGEIGSGTLYSGQLRLHANRSATNQRWVGLKLIGSGAPNTNLSAVGARVYVTAGGVTRMHEVRAGESFMSHHSLEIEMGLGNVSSIDEVRVRWTTGVQETFAGVRLDAYQALREGTGTIEQYGLLVTKLFSEWDRHQVTIRWRGAPWFDPDEAVLERAIGGGEEPVFVTVPASRLTSEAGTGSVADRTAEGDASYIYRLTLRSHGGAFAETLLLPVITELPRLPDAVALRQNFPNPFNPSTQIRFELPATTQVRLEVYDLRGRRVRSLANSRFEAGEARLDFDGRDDAGNRLASGTYSYVLTTPEGSVARRLTLLR